MTLILKPLLQAATQPSLTVPNLTPPPSSASQLSTSVSVPLPSATPCSLQRPDTCSLLDSGDIEGVDLPRCLLPMPHAQKMCSNPSPGKPPVAKILCSINCDLLSRDTNVLSEEPSAMRSRSASATNGTFVPSAQEQPLLLSQTPSPSLSFSMSLSPSASRSPCQGPHPSRPTSRMLLLPPSPSQERSLSPPPSSHPYCSAPPSLSSSPRDRRPGPPPSNPSVISPSVPFHPSTFSLPPSLDFSKQKSRADTLLPGWRNSHEHQIHRGVSGAGTRPQEMEMREWTGQQGEKEAEEEEEEEERNSSSPVEHISFIDEEEPAL